MNKQEETIAALQCALDKANEKLAYISGDENYYYDCESGRKQLNAWWEAHLAGLKTQAPRVMTLEEVKQHNNQDGCIWFEQLTYNAVASFVIQDEECTEIISPYILGEPINHGYWSNSNYNHIWRCWTSKPTNEQRAATPWEEI